MLLPFALIVTGCNGNLKKGKLFNAEFAKQNFFREEIATNYEYHNCEKVDLNLGDGVTAVKYMGGTSDILTVSKAGAHGYYNTATNKFVIPLSEGLTLDSVLTPDESLKWYSGWKLVDGQKIRMVFDDYGNKLWEGTIASESVPWAVGFRRVDRYEFGEKICFEAKVEIGSNNNYVAVAYYNVDRTLREVISIEEYNKRQYEKNTIGESLARYGHSDLHLIKETAGGGTRYVVYNHEKAKVVSTYVVPDSVVWSKTIGDRVLYQIRNTLPQRAKKYDVSIGENKYDYETYSVNYLNGKVLKVKTNLLFFTDVVVNSAVQKDGKGFEKYLYLDQIQEITENKVASPIKKDIIVDEKLNVVADVTGIGYASLAPFDKEHVVSSKNVIYDLELKETGFYERSNLDPVNVATVNGKKTIINYAGKYLVQPIYDKITEVAEGKLYLLESPTEYKFGKLNDNGEVDLYGTLLKSEYEEFVGSEQPQVAKYRVFTKVSDLSKQIFDATNGEKVELVQPLAGSTPLSFPMMQSKCSYKALLDSIDIYAEVYEKDGAYYMIRQYQKITYDFVS